MEDLLMQGYRPFQKKKVQFMKPWSPEDFTENFSISEEDRKGGSPKEGDMIAVNDQDPRDKWLISKKFFEDNYARQDDPTLFGAENDPNTSSK